MERLAMVAFGGNALLRAGEKGTFEEQLRNVEETCAQLVHLLRRGYGIVIAGPFLCFFRNIFLHLRIER